MIRSTSRPGFQALAAGLAGVVFGLGLAIAQMTDPRKVLAFLDVAGAWDPSLLFVLGAAVAVTAIGFALAGRRAAPWFDTHFHSPTARAIDHPLLLGAALFGVGWGLVGYCPGPAIASLGSANVELLWFLPALVAGTLAHRMSSGRARPTDDET